MFKYLKFHVVIEDNFTTFPYLRQGKEPPMWGALCKTFFESVTDEDVNLNTAWQQTRVRESSALGTSGTEPYTPIDLNAAARQVPRVPDQEPQQSRQVRIAETHGTSADDSQIPTAMHDNDIVVDFGQTSQPNEGDEMGTSQDVPTPEHDPEPLPNIEKPADRNVPLFAPIDLSIAGL